MKNKGPACIEFLFSKKFRHAEPCYVLDKERLLANASLLDKTQRATGAKILLALKAFSAWAAFPFLSAAHAGPLSGVCASSLDEARLGAELFGGEVHAFAAAWSEREIREIVHLADHLTFNSLNQWRAFRPIIMEANAGARREKPIICGLRVNPEHSEGAVAIYNPCAPGSRLGIRAKDLLEAPEEDLAGISGLHFHTLCEQGADALQRTLAAFESRFRPWLGNMGWFNFGGGHHISREGYDLELLNSLLLDWHKRYGAQIYLEPGEAVALDAGWLTATVLDIIQADMPIAILDVSAACHMPDVLEMPYLPPVHYEAENGIQKAEPGRLKDGMAFRLAGKSCLAGDVIGEYTFRRPLEIGQRLVFGDMAIYSMVKNTTFNGLRLPSIAIYDQDMPENGEFKILREFSYGDFKGRLS